MEETNSRFEEADERFQELKLGEGGFFLASAGVNESAVVVFLSKLPGAQHQARNCC